MSKELSLTCVEIDELRSEPVQARQSLYQLAPHLDMASLARDIVLFPNEEYEVLMAHGVGFEAHALLKSHPEYILKVQEAREAYEGDSSAIIKNLAKTLMADNLLALAAIVADKGEKGSDRVKAAELLAKIADVMPRTDTSGQGVTGTVVQLNFGPSEPPVVTLENKP